MKTFKQFLEEMDPLDEVGQLMAIRLILGIKNKRDAKCVLDWIHTPGATYDALDDHLSHLIADAMSEAAEVEGLADHLAWQPVKDHLKYEVEKMARGDRATEVSESATGDPLHDLEQELKLVQTYKIKRSDAEKLHAWLNNAGDFYAMSNSAVETIFDAHADIADIEHMPIEMDSLADAVATKAGINFAYDGSFDDI